MSKLKSNTCLAVIKNEEDKLVFAGDRRGSWGMHKAQTTPRPKITKRKGLLFAGTGVGFICDLLTDLLPIPDYDPASTDPFTYLHTTLLPEIKRSLREAGVLEKDNDAMRSEEMHSAVLIGMRGQLFEVSMDTDGVMVDSVDVPYTAGCGGSYALAVIHTLDQLIEEGLIEPVSAEDKLTRALTIAAGISPGCDDNIDILVED